MAETIKPPTSRKAFMEVARKQLAACEKQELEFRAQERRERLLRIAHAHPSAAGAKIPYLGNEQACLPGVSAMSEGK